MIELFLGVICMFSFMFIAGLFVRDAFEGDIRRLKNKYEYWKELGRYKR